MDIVKLKIRAITALASLVLAGPALAACAGTASPRAATPAAP